MANRSLSRTDIKEHEEKHSPAPYRVIWQGVLAIGGAAPWQVQAEARWRAVLEVMRMQGDHHHESVGIGAMGGISAACNPLCAASQTSFGTAAGSISGICQRVFALLCVPVLRAHSTAAGPAWRRAAVASGRCRRSPRLGADTRVSGGTLADTAAAARPAGAASMKAKAGLPASRAAASAGSLRAARRRA